MQIFAAVPFVYELREILDWSATATTLRLYDWLKLEVGWSTDRLPLAACCCQSWPLPTYCSCFHPLQDINMSLYFVTVSQKSRDQRSLGQRVPRYQKLVQVSANCCVDLDHTLLDGSCCSLLICCRCALQGALLFVGLLVLLWVPLLIFSTGK